MITEINLIIEAFEKEKTCVHSSYTVDGTGYTFTAVADDEKNNDILTPETDMDPWLRSFLVSGVKHILDLENEYPTEPIQAKFCLLIRDQHSVMSTKIGMTEVRLVEGGALCKIFYDMVPTIYN